MTILVSDCGRYLAIPVSPEHKQQGGMYNVVDLVENHIYIDGDRRVQNKQGNFALHSRLVVSWSNLGRYNRNNRYIQAFEIGFALVDPEVEIEPFKGNAILERYTARFTRPWKYTPKPKKGKKQ